ncbi:hypothetical protein Taro_001995 [Colocasia esculenta]|uniref:Uncharacterized protein n=1 Tax=Colocasia esculenta TaxID=4460 RepID=A0A843TBK6_COLES|nr:hypothetical protein [Colocasia esculenta]
MAGSWASAAGAWAELGGAARGAGAMDHAEALRSAGRSYVLAEAVGRPEEQMQQLWRGQQGSCAEWPDRIRARLVRCVRLLEPWAASAHVCDGGGRQMAAEVAGLRGQICAMAGSSGWRCWSSCVVPVRSKFGREVRPLVGEGDGFCYFWGNLLLLFCGFRRAKCGGKKLLEVPRQGLGRAGSAAGWRWCLSSAVAVRFGVEAAGDGGAMDGACGLLTGRPVPRCADGGKLGQRNWRLG